MQLVRAYIIHSLGEIEVVFLTLKLTHVFH